MNRKKMFLTLPVGKTERMIPLFLGVFFLSMAPFLLAFQSNASQSEKSFGFFGDKANSWSQEESLNATREFSESMDGDWTIEQYGVESTSLLAYVTVFIWQNGTEMVDNPQNLMKLTLEPPKAQQALEWFVS